MIDVRDPTERAVLVAAPRKGSADARAMTEHLNELAQLVDTAGADVVARVSQHVVSPNPATLIGEGKVEELKATVGDTGATLVVFDEELARIVRDLGSLKDPGTPDTFREARTISEAMILQGAFDPL